ncbi:MAG: 50S ribosomal protein L13 [Deltaproteobacteria bacterium]|nr:50S ribosomal protein L13 [Deltaproteobacteria bacterium]
MKTVSAKKNEVKRKWFVVDADGKVLGRMATKIASVLRGKHKVEYTPHTDTGDFVIVVNASKVKLTGNKENDKMYYHHTGWQGHLNSASASTVRAKHPERIIEAAVKGMLPRGTLGRAMLKKLKVYGEGEHPHKAQLPEVMPL